MIAACLFSIKGRVKKGAAAGAIGALLAALVATPNPLSGFVLRLGWGDVFPASLKGLASV